MDPTCYSLFGHVSPSQFGYCYRCHAQSLAFYFQGSGVPLSVSRSWSDSMCRAHIALKELQVVTMKLLRLAFHLPGKVVALYLNNSTAKAYLCNEAGTVSPFLFRLDCQILSLTNKHSITIISSYISTNLDAETNYLLWGQFTLKQHLLHIAYAGFHLCGLPEVNLLASSHTTQCHHFYTLEILLHLGASGLNAFNHPLKY